MQNIAISLDALPWEPCTPKNFSLRRIADACLSRIPRMCRIAAALVVGAFLGGMLLAFLLSPPSGPFGTYVELRATKIPLIIEPQKPDSILPVASVGGAKAIGRATHTPTPRVIPGILDAPEKTKGFISLYEGSVSIATVDGDIPIARLGEGAVATQAPTTIDDPIQIDMFSASAPIEDKPPLLYGEDLDKTGKPVRWAWLPEDYAKKAIPECRLDREIYTAGLGRLLQSISIPLSGGNYAARAGKYRDFIEQYAEKYNLTTALVLAIMHTESNFNPFAVSPSHAVGLMQVVPDTAGNEVYRYLMGTHGKPSVEALLNPEGNIKYGTTYLHLLSQRYFGGVTNSASRQMCIIAAYNGGPSAVLRLFNRSPDQAVAHINSLSSSEVYTALTTRMPSAETRRYVEVVLGRYNTYSN